MSTTTVSRSTDPKMGNNRLPDLPLVGSDRRWVITKIVLRSIILALAIAIAVMCAIAAVAVYPLTVIVSYPYVSYAYLRRHGSSGVALCSARH